MGNEQQVVTANVDDSTMSADDKHSLSQHGLNLNGEGNAAHNSDEHSGSLQIVPYIYRQDIVRHEMNGAIGIVTEVAGDSDSDGSLTDDEDDEEDQFDDNNEDMEVDVNSDNKTNDGNKSHLDQNNNILQTDQVRVLWMDNTESVQHVNNVVVVDRGFLHGDYVASASDPTGQAGVVSGVNILVDLLAPDGSILRDLSSRDLRRVREFMVGDFVVLGPWLGRVDDVTDNVTVLIDDGSVCKVIGADPLHLKPMSKNFFDGEEHSPYYPGQRVKASSSSVFKNSRWLSGLWKANRLEATVTKVSTGSVFVYWIVSAGCGANSSTPPAEEQSPKDLKLLSCFTHANWQVGEWCLLSSFFEKSSSVILNDGLSKLKLHDKIKSASHSSHLVDKCNLEEVAIEDSYKNNKSVDTDQPPAPIQNSIKISNSNPSTSVSKEPVHETWPLHRKKIRKIVIRREKKARKKEENFEKAYQIVRTRTTVDVTWQDGSIQHGVDSTLLIPVDSLGDHDFIAEEYVVEKASDNSENDSGVRRVGVVKSVDAKERTACVRWLKPVVRADDPREFDKEEMVSVYELEGHPDYDYSYGDAVVRLSPISIHPEATSKREFIGESNQQSEPNESVNATKQQSGSNESSDNFLSLSWVGNITGLRNGDIEVTWADGMVSTVGPQAIFVVGRDEDENSIAAGSEISDAATWETVNDDEVDDLENVQEEVARKNATDIDSEVRESTEHNTTGRNPARSLPLVALDFVTRLAAGIFSHGRKDKDENEFSSKFVTPISDKRNSNDEPSSWKSNAVENCGSGSTEGEGEAAELSTENSAASMCFQDNLFNFKRFDTAKDPLDHHFLSSNPQTNNVRKWFKKVQHDWNILQNDLPDGIYVRVYEDRMDLLRAVIVGAYGTPYQDGLFFFDFYLPPEYPSVPPSAYYHSGGWRINPNLYEEGKVCLSLLNTWTGRGNEVWDPKSSSILQVLVSLQGLVLNSKPYFNEAGYGKQMGTAEGEKNSLSYNENTFLLNCKTMMYLMRRPPKDFDELVKGHFKRRGYYILKACDAYMKGSSIGSLTKDASASERDSSLDLTSVGFKLMLVKIVLKLYMALVEVGADCDEFKHMLQS